VGCGIDVTSGLIFFTLNGQFIDVAFEIPFDRTTVLHPTVGIDTVHSLHFNFGRKPFKFDLTVLPISNKIPKRDVALAYQEICDNSKIVDPRRSKFGSKKFFIANDPRLVRIARFMGLDQFRHFFDDDEDMDNEDDEDYTVGSPVADRNVSDDEDEDMHSEENEGEGEHMTPERPRDNTPGGFVVDDEWDSADEDYQDENTDQHEQDRLSSRKRKRDD